jgi:hypothetical protein
MSVPMMELCPLVAQSEVRTAHDMDPENPRFNCGGYLDLAGELRVDLLEHAVRQVAQECEMLRLRLRHRVPGPGADHDRSSGLLTCAVPDT